MQTKLVVQAGLSMSWLLLGLVISLVGAQEHSAGAQQGITLIETRVDDHSDTNEPPRDKRFFTISRFNGPHSFQPTVPFESLASYVQQQDQFGGHTGSRNFASDVTNMRANNQHFNTFKQQNQLGGRTGSRNFAPDVIDTHANNQHFNNFNQMMSSPQFGSFNGRTGNRPQSNMWPWGYNSDWSQWGWPYGGGFGGRSYGSWGQNNWGQNTWGQTGPWNQFGGRSVSGSPWSQVGGRSGRPGGYWPGYGYGYGYPYGFRQ